MRMQLEEKPSEGISNTLTSQSEIDPNVSKDEIIGEIIAVCFNFLTRKGINLKDFSEQFEVTRQIVYEQESVVQEAYDESNEEDGEEGQYYTNEGNYSEYEKVSTEEDVEAIVNDKENREQFLKQIQDNTEMLKEVFKIYLKDTLHEE